MKLVYNPFIKATERAHTIYWPKTNITAFIFDYEEEALDLEDFIDENLPYLDTTHHVHPYGPALHVHGLSMKQYEKLTGDI